MPSRLEEVLFFEPEQRKDLKDMLSTRKVNDYDYKPLFDKLSQDITLRDEVYYVGNSPISRLTD